MKNTFKYFGIIGICLFSFYYTEKIALYVKNKNPLIQEIKEYSDTSYVSSIDSELIDDIYIIPGLNGKNLNIDKSFNNMKTNMVFHEDELVFNQIPPKVSLENNKNRIIIRGNKQKNSVSLIFNKESTLTDYLIKNNYKINVLLDKEQYNQEIELINNASSQETYTKIEKYLNKKKINKNICYINSNIPKVCKNKYLLKPSLIINHSNLSKTKKQIKSGEIILIQDSISIKELELIILQIKYLDLHIVPLSVLISEIN